MDFNNHGIGRPLSFCSGLALRSHSWQIHVLISLISGPLSFESGFQAKTQFLETILVRREISDRYLALHNGNYSFNDGTPQKQWLSSPFASNRMSNLELTGHLQNFSKLCVVETSVKHKPIDTSNKYFHTFSLLCHSLPLSRHDWAADTLSVHVTGLVAQ
jgi:hypothetical protein